MAINTSNLHTSNLNTSALYPWTEGELELHERIRNNAIICINRIFEDHNYLEQETIDTIVNFCLTRPEVCAFTHENTLAHYSRKHQILNHISMKLKEYINGKF